MPFQRLFFFALVLLVSWPAAASADWLRELQTEAIKNGSSPAAHWGPDGSRYSSWTTHTNRLIPVYTFGTLGAGEGIDLKSYTGEHSVYRDEARLERLFEGSAEDTVSDSAEYMDQTNIFDIQRAALEAGKKHIILVVFDGTDWQTTWAASIANLGRVAYTEGRGVGSHFQEYDANGTTQFSWMVTSPQRSTAQVDVNTQEVKPSGGLCGGYCPTLVGPCPWSKPNEPFCLIAGPDDAAVRHAYTDSASSATSMTCGIKTFNGAIGVGSRGGIRPTIAQLAQAAGRRVGVATSVPISHATPASAYGHNVSRNDYQDLTRDMLGLPSISRPEKPLPGLDVVLGTGIDDYQKRDDGQGDNFVRGNKYLTQQDLTKVDAKNGGEYIVALRTPEVNGADQLAAAAQRAVREQKRLLGFYGVDGNTDHVGSHLPYASANGDFKPAVGIDRAPFDYTEADLEENPTLAQMTTAALTVLSAGDKPFWLMVEAGDVDWANHRNNLDASIGAVNSGDAAVRVITDWVEQHSNWDETVLIVTADHGHYLVLDKPELLIDPKGKK